MGQKRFTSPENRAAVKAQPCVVDYLCSGVIDPDHIVSRGAGGGDELMNLMPICRWHHRMRHDKGILFMCNKYTNYKKWLVENGHAALLLKLEYKDQNNG